MPPEQVAALREGIETFLLASQLTLVNMDQANATFAKAREMAKALPEPSRTFMNYVNDRARRQARARRWCRSRPARRRRSRAVAASARAEPPAAPSTCCTATTTRSFRPPNRRCSATTCARRASNVHLLLSSLITHAEVERVGDSVGHLEADRVLGQPVAAVDIDDGLMYD